METITLGRVEVGRVRELQGPFAPAGDLVPDAPREHWEELGPDFWQPQDNVAVLALQTWVLRSGGRTILVDTGLGTDRFPMETEPRPDLPGLLAAAGVHPEAVDLVINTHLHGDHVGWNTTDGAPTFPNARYLIPAPDNAKLSGDDLHTKAVAPIIEAGLAEVWEGEFRIDADLVLEAAPGHTPGSAVLRLDSGSDRAVFVGDLLHSPVQLLEPAHNSCFDEDPAGAARSRKTVLARAADENRLVFPAHFGGAGYVALSRRPGGSGRNPATQVEEFVL
ncbi:MBL fold metallo-hydrolase [Labedaea rhizosphaerae]|uniref:Glyoxylase-like metal-dependent hydrolase (Beta-lactamase superfamily II) n=1 Tax=Labedaea rhizosphaerae TaxID=598644 RepID=A0A4R6RUE8_LABRH|nr:MBL fold metallo-hydrolase [Labedaea rhizosphaerae]TDP89977.1 glyoxylase-like metal-dependent hydrolase (beta-lactamase superfamily II) [Labedaea rhizosphaerae]